MSFTRDYPFEFKRRNSCHFELGDRLCLDSKVTFYNNSTFALLDSISRPKLQYRALEHCLAQALAMDIPRLDVLSMINYTVWKHRLCLRVL
jgi:hypothetical protein